MKMSLNMKVRIQDVIIGTKYISGIFSLKMPAKTYNITTTITKCSPKNAMEIFDKYEDSFP